MQNIKEEFLISDDNFNPKNIMVEKNNIDGNYRLVFSLFALKAFHY